MKRNKQHIVLIGTGKVASQIGLAFHKNNIHLKGIWGRNHSKATHLATLLNTQLITDLTMLSSNILCLVCVKDSAIQEVIDKISQTVKVAYTSGSIQLSNIKPRSNLGVFYPLQTFSSERNIDFTNIPILIESENNVFREELLHLAQKISSNVRIMDSKQRYELHIAAILVNNFSNYLYLLAARHLNTHSIDFDLLFPLIKETAEKLKYLPPKQAQTGPATRGDSAIIQQHLSTIKDDEIKSIYELFSTLIMNNYKK